MWIISLPYAVADNSINIGKNCSYTRRVYIYPAVGLSWSIREASELWNDLTGMVKGGSCVGTAYTVLHPHP